MTVLDPAFQNAGQKSGLEIWRIEKMKVVMQDPATYGRFFTGDSYIVLHTEQGSGKNSFQWNIHFWLGSETSVDERGAAAYKTVELDDHLGGAPIQHREVQDHESKLFLSYFKKGIKYLKGGVETGFKHVDPKEFEKRLFHVKGKRHVRARQVDCLLNMLNISDVFILDHGLVIYVWIGPQSNRIEQMKGMEMARNIRDEERGGRAQIIAIDEDHLSHVEFLKALGWNEDEDIQIPVSQLDDSEYERVAQHEVKLFKVTDETGHMETMEVNDRPLERSLLDTKDCFILDTGRSGIFAWVGKQCTTGEKSTSMKKALEFVKRNNYPDWTPITRLTENNETALFKQYFSNWPEIIPEVCSPSGLYLKSPPAKQQPKFDISSLHKSIQQRAKTLPDDGRGDVQVWRIEQFEMQAVDTASHGIFHSGDSYIIFYTYNTQGRENYIIYFWQGTYSSSDEKAASAILAMRLDEEATQGRAVQVRVVQGKEPEHFLRIFQGRMIILMGGHASGFRNRNDRDSYDIDGTRLFHVKGTNELNSKAVQVKEKAISLNSNDVFVLETLAMIYVWKGKGANQLEQMTGKSMAERICKNQRLVLIDEGDEPGDFWAALGGRGEYASLNRLGMLNSISSTQGQDIDTIFPPRLFQCSNASGRFYLEEIFNFEQEDLIEDDVMLLDAINEVYIWVGVGANAEEKTEAMKAAQEYIRIDPSNRCLEDVVFITVKQGHEPLSFTAFFHGWNTEHRKSRLPYEELKREFSQDNENIVRSEEKQHETELSLKHHQAKVESSSKHHQVDVESSSKHHQVDVESSSKHHQVEVDFSSKHYQEKVESSRHHQDKVTSPSKHHHKEVEIISDHYQNIKLKPCKEEMPVSIEQSSSASFEIPVLKPISRNENHKSEKRSSFIERPVLRPVSSPAKNNTEILCQENANIYYDTSNLRAIPTTPKSPNTTIPGEPWKTFTLKELQAERPPEGVDITHKENHLNDEDFLLIFKLPKKEFYRFPEWKQQSEKKKKGLF